MQVINEEVAGSQGCGRSIQPPVDHRDDKDCSRTHFVLVHGNGGGAWTWFKIRTRLEYYGYKVSCIDLKSAGIDPTNVSSILTFEDYDEPLIDFLSALPDNEKVILVGHSSGGLSVTDATHRFGKKISVAVYVAATMLKHGFSSAQDKIDGIPKVIREPPTTSTMTRECPRKIEYDLTAEQDARLSLMLHKDGPVKVMVEAKFEDSLYIEEVTRVYIKTMHDQVLLPEQQDAMIKKWQPSEVFHLESDHNPIFTAPTDLVGMLIKAASL